MKLQKILKAWEPSLWPLAIVPQFDPNSFLKIKYDLMKVKINLTFVYLFELLHIQVKNKVR